MKIRLLVMTLIVAVATVGGLSVGVSTANACDTSFWNLGCQYYSPAEGHTGTDFCCSANEAVYTSFDTYSSVKGILTTAGGSWLNSVVLTGSPNNWYTVVSNAGSDKIGCYNHHTGTMFVNCRHFDF